MRCRNCEHTDRFVLLVELSVLAEPPAGPPVSGPAAPPASFSDPDWTLSLSCPACASTDVSGDPVALLGSYSG